LIRARGLRYLPEVVTPSGQHVRVSESSGVKPSIWLDIEDANGSAYALLPLAAAEELRDQLSLLIAYMKEPVC
jgi:hypothetical protein